MADDDLDDDMDDDDEFDDEEEGGSGGGGKKKILLLAIPLVLILGGAAGAYFTGLLDPLLGVEETAEGEGGEDGAPAVGPDGEPLQVAFFDLPEILVNLNTTGRKSSFLKIRVSLELANSLDTPQVETVQDRVVDAFQVYLRELRVEDLKGSAGMYRLREELLARVNTAVGSVKVNDVLFKEMLVQ
ncbi:flagellar basal body-associated FliL family protein [Terasakiella sp. A23]|uniref:flagellar basal body-associated FliL family protein n=1 Tax=Terasakiella sp. FCG-A23 TaxID=3080561 RepID=UPI0029550D05|nr:flagellar basal body-associated FliL family protein [Terasakiella sp. A23]MDV7339069.1 flagellar basal body-associated FliL family protein [Terasakiella sp. A23]